MNSGTGSVHNGTNNKKKASSSTRKFIFTSLKFLVIFIIALGCVAAGITGGAILGYIKTAEPITDEQLATRMSGGTTIIYDSKGNVIQKLTGSDNMDSEPVSDKDVPQYLKDAFISIEDERFESNAGIDIQGMIYGGIGFVKSIVTGSNSGTRGGSTIT
jgi:penicillin-binding protein 1A